MENITSRGRYLVAKDLAERLLPECDMNELLLWPPDLFAFTSYILGTTGGYQLVISPPREQRWPPEQRFIDDWLDPVNAAPNLVSLSTEIQQVWKAVPPPNITKLLSTKPVASVRKWLLDAKSDRKWSDLVKYLAAEWHERIGDITEDEFDLLDRGIRDEKNCTKLFNTLLTRTPPAVLACWAHFYKNAVQRIGDWPEGGRRNTSRQSALPISYFLCNRNFPKDPSPPFTTDELWSTEQSLLTLHAIADETCVGWGLLRVGLMKKLSKKKRPVPKKLTERAHLFAEELLFDRGTMATISPDRCRVLPKRHNPALGITLRSLSCNLAFHRSSVDVVWRRSDMNPLAKKLHLPECGDTPTDPVKVEPNPRMSILLLPLPRHVKTKDFAVAHGYSDRVEMDGGFQFFSYEPDPIPLDRIVNLVDRATKEIPGSEIDMVVLPESSLDSDEMVQLEGRLKSHGFAAPSVLVVGTREKDIKTATDTRRPFQRNAVYCKYWETADSGISKDYGDVLAFKNSLKNGETPKFIQYKHHRWRLDKSQIRQYGLSHVLQTEKKYWEAIKIPKRRVSFLNVGDRMTLCHLICEDLARQDPIADLIRHVGPSMVITILLDGPQRTDRWSSRYASVLSEDPGCSVITLTAFGMVKRWSSPHRPLSRVVALWSEKDQPIREIELATGADAILLNIEVERISEVTADGRRESEQHQTSIFRLVDAIPIFPDPR